MAKSKKKALTGEEALRADADKLAHHVSPQAGNELRDGSQERKAKLGAKKS